MSKETNKTYLNQQTEVQRDFLVKEDKEAGYNLSWGAIFAGIITFIALLFTLSLINAALGFGQFDPTQPNPFAGVGTGQAIWTVIALILSFLGAGFVSGLTSRRVGFVHGFLTWAGSLLATVVLLTWVASSALSAVGSAISTTANVAGDAVSSVASTAGDAVSSGVSALADNVNLNQADVDQFNEDVQEILVDTDIPELQPDYLSNQVSEAATEIGNAAQELVVNPENSEQILNDLGNSLTTRVDNIAESLDEEAVANVIEENTDLTQAEAEEATQNIINGYNDLATQARDAINTASAELQNTAAQVSESVDQFAQEAAVTTNEVTDSASSGAIWAFVGVVLGAVISAIGGSLGVNTAARWVNEGRS